MAKSLQHDLVLGSHLLSVQPGLYLGNVLSCVWLGHSVLPTQCKLLAVAAWIRYVL